MTSLITATNSVDCFGYTKINVFMWYVLFTDNDINVHTFCLFAFIVSLKISICTIHLLANGVFIREKLFTWVTIVIHMTLKFVIVFW